MYAEYVACGKGYLCTAYKDEYCLQGFHSLNPFS